MWAEKVGEGDRYWLRYAQFAKAIESLRHLCLCSLLGYTNGES
jgi:hypothetical protein